jgi:gamma-glutamylcyclotransferase (GGCT)/AIG2-like uncharacterized protein YtfP
VDRGAPGADQRLSADGRLLNEALQAFNALRRQASGDAPWLRLVDRLAHAAFRASDTLIVYGSLSPGAPNHHRLAPLGGTWESGWVEGERDHGGWGAELGFPALRWRPGGPHVSAHLLRSPALRDHWDMLDRFEGAAYERILVPFHSHQGSRVVGYLYAAAPPAVT